MSSPEITFPLEQFLTLIAAIGGATFWLTYKIRGLEKDVENVFKSPYIKAFMDLEEKHAKQRAEMFDKGMSVWEEKKISEEEDTSTTNKK